MSSDAGGLRVGINASLLDTPSLRGWNRYAINLAAALADQGVHLVLYSRRPIHRVFLDRLPPDRITERVAPPMRYLAWEELWLPRQCARDGVDLIHSPFNFGLPWSSPCPRILTLHDAIDCAFTARRPSWRERWSRGALVSGLLHWIARTRADRVITLSRYSRDDLVRHLGIDERRITVVPAAADPRFLREPEAADRQRVRVRHELAKPYFFYVGGWELRKNIPHLLEGFARSAITDAELVLAGGKPHERADLAARAESLGIADRLRLLEWVDDEDLPALYAEALAFVYPSRYEGFGLQVAEAMALGCPTLAARATSLPEVLDDGGVTFSPDDPDELAGALRHVREDTAYRAELAARARARSTAFSWQKTAEQTIAVYRGALGRKAG
jgi:glycosyltransferase involved in cell wall biosynthesis